MSITFRVKFMVKKEGIEAFKNASISNKLASDQEKGCLLFEVFQETDDPKSFLMIESYLDKGAQKSHFESARFNAWKAATKDLIEGSELKQLVQLSM
ncbi:MAG: putative quinol monooxygenase [Bacteroidota bacterium]